MKSIINNILTLNLNFLNKTYPIIIGNNIIYNYNFFLKYIIGNIIVIITDIKISKIYLKKIIKVLFNYKYKIIKIILPNGEKQKNIKNIINILNIFILNKFNKDLTIISLGGGVIGDLSGLCASLYMRGVSLIQIPTTLLSQVDSSIGGKNGINFNNNKNIIGTIFQPNIVIIDISTLKTLSNREFFSGLAEIVKYGIIADYNFFKWIEKNIQKIFLRDKECLKYIIYNSCKIKSNIVFIDEFEKNNIRIILNFGHTFGHALESYFNYKKYLHGEAIILGILFAIYMSYKLNYIKKKLKNYLFFMIKNIFFLKKINNFNSKKILKFIEIDKKNKNGKIYFLLIKNIGKVFLIKIKKKIILNIINNFKKNF